MIGRFFDWLLVRSAVLYIKTAIAEWYKRHLELRIFKAEKKTELLELEIEKLGNKNEVENIYKGHSDLDVIRSVTKPRK